jgi:hypothetical protein
LVADAERAGGLVEAKASAISHDQRGAVTAYVGDRQPFGVQIKPQVRTAHATPGDLVEE